MRAALGDSPSVPVLADPSGDIGSSFGIDELPTNVFVNPRGRIARVTSGPTTADELAQIVAGLQ